MNRKFQNIYKHNQKSLTTIQQKSHLNTQLPTSTQKYNVIKSPLGCDRNELNNATGQLTDKL